MPRPPVASRTQMIRRINLTLEGPVAEVLSHLVPELKKLPRRGVLERVLDDPDLLDRCFRAFRADPERFRALLVDRHNVPVTQADALLACGRSLDDIVAMLVRTCAKRQFRRRLDGLSRPLRPGPPPPAQYRPVRQDGLIRRLSRLLTAHGREAGAMRSRGEALYDAFKDYLRHDWQVPLVPEYSTLSPQLVRALGPRILDYRAVEDIRRLRENPQDPPPPSTLLEAGPVSSPLTAPVRPGAPPPPAAAGDRRARLLRCFSPDLKRLRGEVFAPILLDPAVRAVLSSPASPDQTVRLNRVLADVAGRPARLLMEELDLGPEQLTVMMLVAHERIGAEAFSHAFGGRSNLDYVAKVVERARGFGLGADTSLPEVAAFTRRLFAAFRPGGGAGPRR
ncbi:MAG: hypothetical protein RLZZ501_1927 [Pseudomonadota bacterium]